MDQAARAAFINSQVACAQIEALGMHAENMQRAAMDQIMAYDEQAFDGLVQKYGIGHNDVVLFLRGDG